MKNKEQVRLRDAAWQKWGPYVSDRQWGTVREDYSNEGDPWKHVTHDMARSKAYRWGEDAIAGICDDEQLLCFGISLWNKKDAIIKERFFGLSNPEGNHGEDVKELYYYLDNTPSHSYMKMLYKYPQQQFPYEWIADENKKRGKNELEFELIDTGIFNGDKYFDVFVEYAKENAESFFITITIHNRSNETAALNVLPSLWFRNTWSWEENPYKPSMKLDDDGIISITHKNLGEWHLQHEGDAEAIFCDNDTNIKRLYNYQIENQFYKDGINDYIVHGAATINPQQYGTKAALNYDITVDANSSLSIKLILSKGKRSFKNFDSITETRKKEADDFYPSVINNKDEEGAMLQRQAFAGLLWNKQFYYYNVTRWLNGDIIAPAAERHWGKNSLWKHFNGKDILLVPDKWEFPWFAAWDTAFQCIPFALIDAEFAKKQLLLLASASYMNPNGQLPAYEWDFDDCNPPIHAIAAWIVYCIDKDANKGKGDIKFLEKIFHKLMINFTWWVNRKDANGSNVFEGGFLGLDNIGVFDRNVHLPNGGRLEQADATSWMGMYSLNLLRIAAELASYNDVYEDVAPAFFEHFLSIAGAMSGMNLWDEEDGFYYDCLRFPGNDTFLLKARSIIGFTPLFAVEVIHRDDIYNKKDFHKTMKLFRDNSPGNAALISNWQTENKSGKHLFGLLTKQRLQKILNRMLDEKEFLSEYGIRSLSKFHQENPFHFNSDGGDLSIHYTAGESDTGMYGGNSNWRGPIWVPLNFLIIESLRRYHEYYGGDLKTECPVGSGIYLNLGEVADELAERLANIFRKNENGNRPVNGNENKFNDDANFNNYPLFHEYFDGDNGKGLGASHQTGWTSLIIRYLFAEKTG